MGLIRWVRRVRAALRVYDDLPSVVIGFWDPKGQLLGTCTTRVTARRGWEDNVVIATLDRVRWTADRACIVSSVGRIYHASGALPIEHRALVMGDTIEVPWVGAVKDLDR